MVSINNFKMSSSEVKVRTDQTRSVSEKGGASGVEQIVELPVAFSMWGAPSFFFLTRTKKRGGRNFISPRPLTRRGKALLR